MQTAHGPGWIFLFFYAWLKEFDIYVSKTPGRHVVLLLDNASAHGKIEDLPVLSNVEVIFLRKKYNSIFTTFRCRRDRFSEKTIQKKAISTCFVVDWKWKHKKLVQCERIISYGIINYELEWNRSKDYSQLLEKTGINDSSTTTYLEEEEIEAFNSEGEDDCVGSISDSELIKLDLKQQRSKQ